MDIPEGVPIRPSTVLFIALLEAFHFWRKNCGWSFNYERSTWKAF
jgi:hypothetical protein